MLSRRQMLAMVAATATVAPLTTACSRSQPAKAGAKKTLDKVTYLTAYGTTPREEYGSVTKAQGYFTKGGMDVTVAPGKPSTANIDALMGSHAQFASIDFVSAVKGYAYSKGAICIIAAIQHSTLLSVTALPGSGITQPSDLIGKKIGTGQAAATATLFPTYAKLAGFDGSKVTIQQIADTNTLPQLLAHGQLDGIGGYSIDVPTVRKAAGGKSPIVLPYAKFIGDLYGTVILTTTKFAQSQPDLVRRFATAIMAGTNFAVNNADQAGKDIHDAVPANTAADAAETMSLMKPYVDTGILDPARITRGITLLAGAGMIPANTLTADQLVRFDLGPQAA